MKFGLRKLAVKDEEELAEYIIDTSEASLTLQQANVRYLLEGEEGEGFKLEDYSQDQLYAVETYGQMKESELIEVAFAIIEKRDIDQNIQNRKDRAAAKVKKSTKKSLKKI